MAGTDIKHQAIRAGLDAYDRGEMPAAISAFRTATTLAPSDPAARNLLGAALLAAGEAAAATAELEQAARLAKNDPAILGNLAQAYAAAGRHEEALQVFRKAARIEPRRPQYTEGVAITLAQLGKTAEAATLLERLTARFPDIASPWYNLGNIHRGQLRWAEAERCFRETLTREPAHVEAHNNLGSVLHGQMRYSEAAAAYQACIAARPEYLAAHLNLVSVLMDDGRFAEAEQTCRGLLLRAPDLPEAHRFLGAIFGHQGRIAEALPAYAQAASLAPDDPVALRACGGALAENGQLHPALRLLAEAARLDPATDALAQLESSIFLAHGLFADGWAAYRRRPAFLRIAEKLGADTLTQDLPADLAGKQIRLLREQGIGDELFFLRYAPQLRALGARVTIRASTKIAALIARAACADEVTAEDDPVVKPADLQLLCGDLPHALYRITRSTNLPRTPSVRSRDFDIRIAAYFPALPSTLHIPVLPDAATAVSRRLQQYGPPPYLGVTWRAGTAARDQIGADWALSKELPLPALAHTLRAWPGTLLALQRHPAAGELDAFAAAAGKAVHDCTDLNDDLEQMLALLALIDDYAGVSNTNMHLRAAAGRGARVLVPNPAEWRWMAAGRDSPWFPDFRLYRQSRDGNWQQALSDLARDLQ
jgi:Flp pilus assembly protein TadD